QQAFIAKEEEFIRRNLAGQRTKEAQGRRKRLERLKRERGLERPRHARKIALSLQADLRSGDLVLATHNLVLGYPGGDPLLSLPDLEIRRGERVALVGPNGSGKTTLLKTIARQIPPQRGRIRIGAAVEMGYFAQIQSDLNPQNTVLDEILQVNHNMTTGEARTHLGRFLFSGEDVFKKVSDLSGGERSRLALAKFALTGANFLLLDEPTNHLDIPAREVLEEVLANFNGTILLVSHDRYFVDRVATRVWAIEGERITDVAGNYTAYLTHRQAQETLRRPETPPSAGKDAHRRAKLQRRARQQRARRLAELEAAIEAAQERLAELTRALEEAGYAQDVDALHKLGEEYRQTETTLTQLLDKWIAMEAA
ncbi:MAG: ABC transporter ATP-binding protein, partial [Caldilineae bacterium]